MRHIRHWVPPCALQRVARTQAFGSGASANVSQAMGSSSSSSMTANLQRARLRQRRLLVWNRPAGPRLYWCATGCATPKERTVGPSSTLELSLPESVESSATDTVMAPTSDDSSGGKQQLIAKTTTKAQGTSGASRLPTDAQKRVSKYPTRTTAEGVAAAGEPAVVPGRLGGRRRSRQSYARKAPAAVCRGAKRRQSYASQPSPPSLLSPPPAFTGQRAALRVNAQAGSGGTPPLPWRPPMGSNGGGG